MKRIKNNTQNSGTWCGQEIASGAYYTIPAAEYERWGNDDAVLQDIANADLLVNDGAVDFTSVSLAINFLKDVDDGVRTDNAFAAKTIKVNGVVKKLYKRQHGQQFACSAGNNDILFTVPYPWVKITGIRLINGEALDTCSFYILDSTTGTYTTIPNYILNQFGANVNIAAGDHEEHCKYDADLYTGMQIKLVYNSQSAKTIGINYVLHEVKD